MDAPKPVCLHNTMGKLVCKVVLNGIDADGTNKFTTAPEIVSGT
jgi:hypothetical protein